VQRAQPVTAPWSVARTRPTPYTRLARVCFVALALRCLCVLCVNPEPAWDGIIYERAAEQLAHGEGYTQRILDEAAPARPTAFFPPGFPAVLSVLHRAAGGRLLDPWFQVAMSLLLLPAAWLFGRRLGGLRAGLWAAWLCALWPGGVLLTASWFTEPLFAVLLCAAILPILYARRRARTRALVGAALLLGLAAYVRPTALAIVPFVGAAVGYLAQSTRRFQRVCSALTWAVLATSLACLPLAPWIARNQVELRAPVLVSTNAGFNLLLGTVGEGSYGPLPEAIDCPGGVPEVARDRCRFSHGLARIRRDPALWLARDVLKALHTFGHESAPAQLLAAKSSAQTERWSLLALAITRVFWLPFIALAAMGGMSAWRHSGQRGALLLLLTPVVGTLLLHCVFIGGDRYHIPLVPLFAGLAGYSVTLLWPRPTSRQPAGPVPS
jgi:4-amino-4-deoxy-L-arabinose transferase-like glycosyltransferase